MKSSEVREFDLENITYIIRIKRILQRSTENIKIMDLDSVDGLKDCQYSSHQQNDRFLLKCMKGLI